MHAVLLFVMTIAAVSCCKFVVSKTHFDFAPLKGEHNVSGTADYDFVVSVCGNVHADCKGMGSQFMALQLARNPIFPVPCYYLSAAFASQNIQVSLIDEKNAKKGAVMRMLHGEQFYNDAGDTITRMVKVTIYCNKTQTANRTLTYDGEASLGQYQEYKFVTHHAAGCPST